MTASFRFTQRISLVYRRFRANVIARTRKLIKRGYAPDQAAKLALKPRFDGAQWRRWNKANQRYIRQRRGYRQRGGHKPSGPNELPRAWVK